MFRSIRSVVGLCRRHEFHFYRTTQKCINPTSYGCLPHNHTGAAAVSVRFKYINHGVQGRRGAKLAGAKDKHNKGFNEDGEEVDDDDEGDEDEDENADLIHDKLVSDINNLLE